MNDSLAWYISVIMYQVQFSYVQIFFFYIVKLKQVLIGLGVVG